MANIFGTNGDDPLNGTASADSIFAKKGSDTVQAGDGDDTILIEAGVGSSTSANDQIDGGTGKDTVVLSGDMADYAVSFDFLGNLVLTGKAGTPAAGESETLISVESVVFDDQVMRIVDATGAAGSYTTIQSAVDESSEGDTVIVLNGTYNETVTVSKGINIVGEGADKVTIDSTQYGIHLTGDIDNGGSATVSISGVNLEGNQVGVRVSSNTQLANLVIDDSTIKNNATHGVGTDSGAFGLGAVTITNSTFTDNGTGGANGGASIVLFGFTGDATITGVDIIGTGAFNDPVAGLPDNAIQINGRDPVTYDVTAPLGAIILNDVDITGAYHKPPLLIQGYNDLSGFSATDVEITASSTWGQLVFVDPISTSGAGTPGTAGQPGAYVGTGGAGSLDLSGITVTNQGTSDVDTFVRGSDKDDTLTGTAGNDMLNFPAETNIDYGGADTLNGGAGDDQLFGGLGNDALDGGADTDTAVFAGSSGDYTITAITNAGGFVTGFSAVADTNAGDGDDGTDTLTSIEVLSFLGNSVVVDASQAVQLFDGSNALLGTFATIGDAVAAASAGDTVLVSAGTYNEDVIIDKSITLLSVDGAATTIINGQNGALGAIEIDPNVDDVTIGGLGQGFTIRGNNGNGAIENAAVYLQGAHDNITVQGNIIEARGDAGLMNEYGAALTNSTIDSNAFTGQTFVGPNPGGNGFSTQFDVGNNVPRQLVVVGNGGSAIPAVTNLTFTNNTLSGIAGGLNISAQEQGNNLATLDAANSLIDGNTFTGITARYATALRVRQPDTDITNNTFDNSGGGDTRGVFLQNQNGTEDLSGNDYIGGANNDLFYGSNGDETMTGAGADDTLVGNGGDDDLDGGTGTDTAGYAGNRDDFSITQNLDGSYTVTDTNAGDGDEGTDTVTDIENLKFADHAYSFELDVNSPDFAGATERFAEDFNDGTVDSRFSTGPTAWSGAITVQDSGTGGIVTGDGGKYAVFEQTNDAGGLTGPFSRFDGYRKALTGGFTTSFDVYLDKSKMTVGEGFDVSVAASKQDGSHLREFVFHVTHDTSTGEILIGGSNNTNFDPREDLDNQNHAEIAAAGWYTLEWKFYENDAGDLEVAMNVYDDAGAWVFTEIRTTASDDFATVYGGNRYMWFTNIDVAAGIATDNFTMSTEDANPVQVKDGNTITGSYPTIAAAVAAALAGNTIDIAPGDYSGDGTVSVTVENLTFVAPAGATGFALELAPGILAATLTGDGDIDLTGNAGDNSLTGNDGANVLTGNDGADTLVGSGGDDDLDGGSGGDTAGYAGNRDDFSITQNLDGSYTVTDTNAGDGDEGTDTVTDIENLKFADHAYSFELDVNSPDFAGATERFAEDFNDGTVDSRFVTGPASSGAITVQDSGTGGIVTGDGGKYAVFEQTNEANGLTGPFSRFDGYRSGLTGGFTTSFDVYLDKSKMTVGEGFDVSVAANRQTGNHLRDFIFHVTHDTSTGEILIGGSNGTNFDPREDLDNQNHAEIAAAGWYTLEWKFYENDAGDLEVAMNVYDDAGAWVFTEVRSQPGDDFATVYGGNRYLWFTNIDVAAGIATDNFTMSTEDANPVQVKDGNTITGSYPTIAAAVAAALAGNTIDIAPGDYSGDGTVSVTVENLTFVAPAGATGFALELAPGILAATLTGDGDIDLTGNAGNNTLTGNTGANVLTGGGGADTLIGNAGNDRLDGGTGADTMTGGTGNDTYVVDNVGDVVTELAGQGTDTVETTLVKYSLSSNVENGTHTGAGAHSLYGNPLNNILTAGNGGGRLTSGGGNDTLIGGNGVDILNGFAGNNTMMGGESDDVYYINTVGDTVIDTGASNRDQIISDKVNVDLSAATGVEVGKLIGSLDLDLIGDAGENFLTGNAGVNHITGGQGIDRIYGLGGDDVFVFTAVSDSTSALSDRILDFEQGVVGDPGDIIDLWAIDAIDGGRNNAFTFIGDSAFSNKAGELRYQFGTNGYTYISADTNGDAVADMVILLQGLFTLEDADFVL